jgi:hypothetical protein
MKRLVCAALVALAAAASGCATAQAKADPAGGPALTPPPPPAHSISPVEIPPEPPPPPADTAPTPIVVKTPPRPASPRSDRLADKAGEKPEAATPGGAASSAVPGAATPALQTTANVSELERRVRARMSQASRDLDRTDYRVLSSERRVQYDTAKRFIQQADDALKVMNLVFAEQLADKAATLAAALVQK